MSEKKIWEKNPEQKIIEKKQNKEIIDFANKIFDADEIANIIESIKTSGIEDNYKYNRSYDILIDFLKEKYEEGKSITGKELLEKSFFIKNFGGKKPEYVNLSIDERLKKLGKIENNKVIKPTKIIENNRISINDLKIQIKEIKKEGINSNDEKGIRLLENKIITYEKQNENLEKNTLFQEVKEQLKILKEEYRNLKKEEVENINDEVYNEKEEEKRVKAGVAYIIKKYKSEELEKLYLLFGGIIENATKKELVEIVILEQGVKADGLLGPKTIEKISGKTEKEFFALSEEEIKEIYRKNNGIENTEEEVPLVIVEKEKKITQEEKNDELKKEVNVEETKKTKIESYDKKLEYGINFLVEKYGLENINKLHLLFNVKNNEDLVKSALEFQKENEYLEDDGLLGGNTIKAKSGLENFFSATEKQLKTLGIDKKEFNKSNKDLEKEEKNLSGNLHTKNMSIIEYFGKETLTPEEKITLKNLLNKLEKDTNNFYPNKKEAKDTKKIALNNIKELREKFGIEKLILPQISSEEEETTKKEEVPLVIVEKEKKITQEEKNDELKKEVNVEETKKTKETENLTTKEENSIRILLMKKVENILKLSGDINLEEIKELEKEINIFQPKDELNLANKENMLSDLANLRKSSNFPESKKEVINTTKKVEEAVKQAQNGNVETANNPTIIEAKNLKKSLEINGKPDSFLAKLLKALESFIAMIGGKKLDAYLDKHQGLVVEGLKGDAKEKFYDKETKYSQTFKTILESSGYEKGKIILLEEKKIKKDEIPFGLELDTDGRNNIFIKALKGEKYSKESAKIEIYFKDKNGNFSHEKIEIKDLKKRIEKYDKNHNFLDGARNKNLLGKINVDKYMEVEKFLLNDTEKKEYLKGIRNGIIVDIKILNGEIMFKILGTDDFVSKEKMLAKVKESSENPKVFWKGYLRKLGITLHTERRDSTIEKILINLPGNKDLLYINNRGIKTIYQYENGKIVEGNVLGVEGKNLSTLAPEIIITLAYALKNNVSLKDISNLHNYDQIKKIFSGNKNLEDLKIFDPSKLGNPYDAITDLGKPYGEQEF